MEQHKRDNFRSKLYFSIGVKGVNLNTVQNLLAEEKQTIGINTQKIIIFTQ